MTQDSTPTSSHISTDEPSQKPSQETGQKDQGGSVRPQLQTPLIPAPFLKPYDPIETEPRIQAWERNDSNPKESIYNPDFLIAQGIIDPSAPGASIILPPPNVTGTLHLGHGLMVTIQDILMRKARMDGKKVLWIPGTDHAAIATQSVVEKEISKKEGKSRYDIGREEMLRRIGDFANQSHDTIVSQVKRMGASLDWSREAFTLDDARNLAVRTMFKRMFDDGLIYRGFRIVNWDPKGQTTIADDELVYKEETTKFYYFKYGPFTIGTARPETKFGDKYVVMHPEDARYAQYSHGQKITVEWINGPIEATIIKDESIDMEFGTGVMTITPWHSAVDFALAEKHKLDKGSPVIDLFGKLLPIAGDFAGRKISEVREDLVKAFGEKDLIAKAPDENYVHRIATAERSGGVIEPQVLQQWFVAVNTPFTIPHSEINGIESGSQTTLKEIMRKAVDPAFGHKTLGPVAILPDHFNKTYFHWIDNLNDWCISRQIWYGHRIPAYYDLSNEANFTLQLGFKNTKISTPEFYDQYIGPLSLKLFAENSDKSSDYLNRFNSMTDKNGNTVVSGYIAHKLFLDGIISKEDLQTCQRITTDQNSVIEIITDDSDIKLLDKCYIQDPDTLDTWFSSGLWSFSTLGWPGTQDPNTRLPIAGSELATYHPTTILVTGYEILFFWVARMILMTGYGLGTIPFKTVYLNGTIRDSQGRKMSKSLGNGGDPIQISDKYGADALRMFYAMSNTPGTDSRIYEDKIKGFKHFANKVWNITRFVLTAIAENPHAKDQTFNPDFFTGVYAPEAYSGPTEQDRMILAEWRTTLKTITEHLDAYRIHLAAEELYGYLWRTFADKILEESKPILKPGFADLVDGHLQDHTSHPSSSEVPDGESIAEKIIEADQLDSTDLALKRQAALSRAQTLMTILRESLLTLHPFMPHVTQEIWSLLPQEMRNDTLTHGMIAIEKWPMHHI